MSAKKGSKGSTFDDFLEEEGVYDETNSIAIKRVLAWQLAQAMEENQISKARMAREMHTSRTQLDRILDPENDKVQLDTIIKVAKALGRRVHIELV